MKIVFISDTHNATNISLPEGDLLIHSGDCAVLGTLREVIDFNTFLGQNKHKYTYGVVFVPGNHDFLFQNQGDLARDTMTNAKVLINEQIVINNLVIYGSPITPTFGHWAFLRDRGEEIKKEWDRIPKNTDILVTHGPPKSVLDKCPGGSVGCEELYFKVMEIKPKVHAFGHIHESYGTLEVNGIKFINSAIMNGLYFPVNKPIVYDLK